MFPDHISSILDGALVGAGSLRSHAAATGITRFWPNLALPHMGHYSSTVHSLGRYRAHTKPDTLHVYTMQWAWFTQEGETLLLQWVLPGLVSKSNWFSASLQFFPTPYDSCQTLNTPHPPPSGSVRRPLWSWQCSPAEKPCEPCGSVAGFDFLTVKVIQIKKNTHFS
jgi:hypothetical protein